MPNRYYCIYILATFLRSIWRLKLTLTLLTNKTPNPTIVSSISFRIKPVKVNLKLNRRVFFGALGTNGLNDTAEPQTPNAQLVKKQFAFLVPTWINPLMPYRYTCTYVSVLFLRSNCCKRLTQTLLTHKLP